MVIEAFTHESAARKLKLGMVGGGRGAFIGAVHRMAARLDDKWELAAGALSANAENAKVSAADLGIAADRGYADFEEMAAKESKRGDGIDAVAIVTPNHLHFKACKAFLDAGIHVICDKPLTLTLKESVELVKIARKSGLVFVLTQNNTGYPLVRQARQMVREGTLGEVRVVSVSYIQDWLTTNIDQQGQKQAEWRTDPKRQGAGGSVGDIGVHAFNLAAFVSGLELDSVCADLKSNVSGRKLDDNANVLLRYKGGANGNLWASQVAVGNFNRLAIKLYGSNGGIEWCGEDNDNLTYAPFGEPVRQITRGGPGTLPVAQHATRMPPRHPEGYIEGFANLYSNAAELIWAAKEKRKPDPLCTDLPTVEDGARGLAFIEACVESSAKGGVWTKASVDL